MRPHVAKFVDAALGAVGKVDRVLEVGSYKASDGPQVRDLVGSDRAKAFFGIDMRAGDGVDAVADILDLDAVLDAVGGCFDVIVCVDTLEHVKDPKAAVENMLDLLAEDGYLVLATPFAFQIHEHPQDFWRFTQEGLKALMDDGDVTVTTWQDPPGEWPHTVFAIGQLQDTAVHKPLDLEASWLTNHQTVIPNPDPSKSTVVASFDSPKQRELFLEKARCETAAEQYHHLVYNSGVWQHSTHYKGFKICKTPVDLWSYQELLFMYQPTLLIETGTAYGGSALYFADLLAPLGGTVLSIDIAELASPIGRPQRKNIQYLLGSSVASEVADVAKQKAAEERVVVVLDSDHSKAHVLKELELYAPLATTHIIVEDSNINGHPVASGFGPGPKEAVQEFLASPLGQAWEEDLEWRKHGFSFNTWLRRK